jgi:Fe-S-cluster containining protein
MIKKNTPLKEVLKLASPCSCSACNHGCKFGSGSLLDSDVGKIAEFLGVSDKKLKEEHLEEKELFNKKVLRPRLVKEGGNSYGRCTFFNDKKGCTIHDVKPFECKTSMGCKDYGEDLSIWFMVNHIVDSNDAESIRQYAQYIKTGGKIIPGASLEELVPDKERLKKILSYEILK